MSGGGYIPGIGLSSQPPIIISRRNYNGAIPGLALCLSWMVASREVARGRLRADRKALRRFGKGTFRLPRQFVQPKIGIFGQPLRASYVFSIEVLVNGEVGMLHGYCRAHEQNRAAGWKPLRYSRCLNPLQYCLVGVPK